MKTTRTRTRSLATTAKHETKATHMFLDTTPKAPDSRALATAAFQDAFGEIAQARVDELRAEIFQTAEQIARAFVQSHERALENSLKID